MCVARWAAVPQLKSSTQLVFKSLDFISWNVPLFFIVYLVFMTGGDKREQPLHAHTKWPKMIQFWFRGKDTYTYHVARGKCSFHRSFYRKIDRFLNNFLRFIMKWQAMWRTFWNVTMAFELNDVELISYYISLSLSTPFGRRNKNTHTLIFDLINLLSIHFPFFSKYQMPWTGQKSIIHPIFHYC